MDVGLWKAPCVSCYYHSTFRVSSTNYYLVCSFPIHKICAFRAVYSVQRDFCAIDDGKLRCPRNPGSGWVNVIESHTPISQYNREFNRNRLYWVL